MQEYDDVSTSRFCVQGTELKDGQSLDNDYNKVSSMPKRYVRKPKGIKEAETAPVNMPNEGHYPGVK